MIKGKLFHMKKVALYLLHLIVTPIHLRLEGPSE